MPPPRDSLADEPNRRRIPWWPLWIAGAAIAITQVPFWLGDRWAPNGAVFDGMSGMTHDQNMYFSYIRQGAEGEWLFVDRLTHVDHRPALLNLQWLAVGRLANWLGGSLDWAYAIWRIVGSLMLVLAFWWLAGVAGLNRFQQRLAVVLCAFGGGFGWVFLVLERTGLVPSLPIAMLDISDAVHPFSHIFFNPHLSVSHGFSLMFLAAYALGEQTGRLRWYLIAAAIAALHGLTRPYDLILIYGALPLYVLTELVVTREWSWRKTALRCVPLVVTAPVIAYYAALFQLHPVFKHWASQGVVKPIGIPWHLFSLGVACLLCLVRLCLVRRFPLKSQAERLLLAWIAAVLFLFHGHKIPLLGFMPYTPVFGMTLPSAMLLLGAALFNENWLRSGYRAGRIALLAMLVGVSSLGSVVWMAKIVRNLAYLPEHYIPAAEYETYEWLSEHAGRNDVILSTLYSGNRMAKYISSRFVLGHLSVTPNVREISERVERFYRGEMSEEETVLLLDEFNVDWIYLSPTERALGDVDLRRIPGVFEEHSQAGVQVFSYRRDRPGNAPHSPPVSVSGLSAASVVSAAPSILPGCDPFWRPIDSKSCPSNRL
jgi:hypothetical protein